MKFAINLKPYPAAEYFTVKDHQRTFKTLDQFQAEGVLDGIISMLRGFHGIPASFRVATHHEGRMADIRTKFENLIVKDNPVSGTDDLSGTNPQKTHGALLDLSFSFPVTAKIPDAYDAILIDPSAGLGIPGETVFLFTKQIVEGLNSSDIRPAELYLLDNVLRDIELKGLDMIVRETNYKAAVLYQMIEDCQALAPVADKKMRSKSMISVLCDGAFARKIENMGYRIGISGNYDETQITIANYATHSKEMIELFSDRIMAL